LLAAGACPAGGAPATAAAATAAAALSDADAVVDIHHAVVAAEALSRAGAPSALVPSPRALKAAFTRLAALQRDGGAYAAAPGGAPSALAGARVAAAAALARSLGAAPRADARALVAAAAASPDGCPAFPGDGDSLLTASLLLRHAADGGAAEGGAALARHVAAAAAAATATPAGAAAVVLALAAAPAFNPVAIVLVPESAAPAVGGGEKVRVRVTALDGSPAPSALASVSATLTDRDGTVVASDVPLHASAGSDEYAFDLARAVKGVAGPYAARVVAAGGGVLGAATLQLALVQPITFVSGAAGVAGEGGGVVPLAVGAALPAPATLADPAARFKVEASLATAAGAPAELIQFGAVLKHANGAEGYVPGGPAAVQAGAAAPAAGAYRVTITPAAVAAAVGPTGGRVTVTLVAGGAATGEGVEWEVGSLDVAPGDAKAAPPPPAGPLPVIRHQFRAPDKRASPVIAVAFSALTAAPLALLWATLSAAGANLKGFPASGAPRLAALAFFGGLASVLALYGVFWVRLNLLQLVPPLALAGSFTALAGRAALGARAAARGAAAARKAA
jgi:hypothetical protein